MPVTAITGNMGSNSCHKPLRKDSKTCKKLAIRKPKILNEPGDKTSTDDLMYSLPDMATAEKLRGLSKQSVKTATQATRSALIILAMDSRFQSILKDIGEVVLKIHAFM